MKLKHFDVWSGDASCAVRELRLGTVDCKLDMYRCEGLLYQLVEIGRYDPRKITCTCKMGYEFVVAVPLTMIESRKTSEIIGHNSANVRRDNLGC